MSYRAKILFILCIILWTCIYLMGCSNKSSTKNLTLHNYPYFDDMDCPKEFSIDNEDELKASAKMLNMRYVDYLHYINRKKHQKALYSDY